MAEDNSSVSSYEDAPRIKRHREDTPAPTPNTNFLGNTIATPLSVYERVRKWQKVWVNVKHFKLLKWVLVPDEQQPPRNIIDPNIYNRLRFANKQLRVEASEQIKLGTFNPASIQDKLNKDEQSGVQNEYVPQQRVTFKGIAEEEDEDKDLDDDEEEEDDDERDDRNEQIKRLEQEAVKIQRANEEVQDRAEEDQEDEDEEEDQEMQDEQAFEEEEEEEKEQILSTFSGDSIQMSEVIAFTEVDSFLGSGGAGDSALDSPQLHPQTES
jgi:hypothetical protein